MSIRSELWISVLIFLFIQILTSLACIALLTRMSPAIERVLEENVASVAAVEDMLVALNITDSDMSARLFENALIRARQNITVSEEASVLDLIGEHWKPAIFERDTVEVGLVRNALQKLSEINRSSIRKADDRAQSLGMGGAWGTVFLGLLGFVLSIRVIRHLNRNVISPISELQSTVQAFRNGDTLRRCRTVGVPKEFNDVGSMLNELLDQYLFQKLKQRDREETVPFDALARQYLKSLPGPAALLNLQTRKWWGNSAINEEDAELKTILEHWQQGEPLPEDSHWQTTRVTGTQWLVVLHERKSSD